MYFILNNSFKGIVKSNGSDVLTKSTGAQYVLMNVEITEGPAKGLVVCATRTTVTAEGVIKSIPKVGEEVVLNHTVVPSTKEGEKNKHFFEVMYVVKRNQELMGSINSLFDKFRDKIEKYNVNSMKDTQNNNFPDSYNGNLTSSNFAKSILIGVITAILIGFIFSNSTYFFNNVERSFDDYEHSDYDKNDYVIKEEFNYKLAFISSALVVAFIVFVYYDERRKQFLLIKISSLFTKKRIEKAAVENVEENHTQKTSINSNDNLNGFKSFRSELINIVKEDIFGSFINFKTRLPRGLYFLYMCLINLFFYAIFYSDTKDADVIVPIFSIICLYFLIKIYILRLHDMNYSGWNSLFCLIPLFIIFIAKVSNIDFLNDIMLVLSIPAFVFIILFHILLLLIPGTKGNNHYGSN